VFGHPHGIGFENRGRFVVPAKLVASCHEYFVMAFGYAQAFHTPGCTPEHGHSFIIPCDTPIRANHPVIAILAPQHVCNEIAAESIPDIFTSGILVKRDGIIGHHRRCHTGAPLEFKGPLHKGQQVGFQVVAGENGKFSEPVMRIAPGFPSAPAWPVFYHGIDTAIAPASCNLLPAGGSLKTINIGLCHIGCQARVAPESAAEAVPAGIGGQVYLRR